MMSHAGEGRQIYAREPKNAKLAKWIGNKTS